MSEKNRYADIRVYTDVTVRVPSSYVLDMDEYREWYEKAYPWAALPSNHEFLDFDEVLEFLTDSTDTESEVGVTMPDPDVNVHDIISSEIVEAEYG